MARIASLIYLLALASLFGGLLTVTLIVAPVLFRALDRPDAAAAVGAILPPSYTLATLLAATAFIALLAATAATSRRQALTIGGAGLKAPRVETAFVGLALLLLAAGRLLLFPELSGILAGGGSLPEGEAAARFATVHGQAMALNLAALGATFIAVCLAGTRLR